MNTTTHHRALYVAPPLTSEDEAVLGEIHRLRRELRFVLRTPRRWEGGLRRSALARNIRGSNSIEGYDVAEDDAAAAIDGEEPFSADEGTFLEIQGYRQALGYVLAMSDADYATFDTTELRAMHYMMLGHDLSKSPGALSQGTDLTFTTSAATGSSMTPPTRPTCRSSWKRWPPACTPASTATRSSAQPWPT